MSSLLSDLLANYAPDSSPNSLAGAFGRTQIPRPSGSALAGLAALTSNPLGSAPGLLPGGLGLYTNPATAQLQVGERPWRAVRQRFKQLNGNLLLTKQQRDAGLNNAGNVVECLNRHYYGTSSRSDNAFLIGSWAKDTVIDPPRDVDVAFVLPPEVHARFQNRATQRQSGLLQEVKNVVGGTYSRTNRRGDGQVVVFAFSSFSVEVVPVFRLESGRYWICDTNDGGCYKVTDPDAQLRHIEWVDKECAGNLRPLIRMAKAWQQECNVWSLDSFQLELIAAHFLQSSEYRLKDWFWFDWLVRDFFAYLCAQNDSVVIVPGTHDVVQLGSDWHSKAISAYGRALKACEFERDNNVTLAGDEWQKIFGSYAPKDP